ncbi:MAG: hypothetical protein AW07_04481 [Candidatus Accumulibacter sp. SK-11]|nr:MAG: hypothetical protein AW07_04481 [Candidatus Accumulibacter sp. SK-11]
MPKSIWLLGGVSLFMDIPSEPVHCLLPIFMVGTPLIRAISHTSKLSSGRSSRSSTWRRQAENRRSIGLTGMIPPSQKRFDRRSEDGVIRARRLVALHPQKVNRHENGRCRWIHAATHRAT